MNTKLTGKVIRLEGRDCDLQYLSERFSSSDFAIIKYGNTYFLKIAGFDSKTEAHKNVEEQDFREAGELHDSALKLVQLINGEAQLERALFGSATTEMQYEDPELLPIQVTKDVHEFRGGNPVHGTARIDVRLTASQTYQLTGKVSETIPTSAILAEQRELIASHFPLELAKRDEKVDEALTYFGYPHDWNNLYKTWEVIRPDLGKLPKDNVINSDNDDLFKKTANHYRHGGDAKAELPDNAMSLSQADHYIKVFMIAWLTTARDHANLADPGR